MSAPFEDVVRFKRNHFSARLPKGYSYTLAHFWLYEHDNGEWRIGLTSFATRMLGEIVEFEFEVKPKQSVKVAQVVGWIEGFKAVSDIFCVANGQFVTVNAQANDNPEVICNDPFGDGWLYSVRGQPDPQVLDVDNYVEHLNRTIDKMLDQPWKSGELNAGEQTSP